MHLLIVGCGYIGQALVVGARAVWGAALQVSALRRSAAALPQGVRPIALDLASSAAWPRLSLPPVDAVVFCSAPEHPSTLTSYEAIYVHGTQRVLAALKDEGHRPRHVIFVSSTGVYGQDDGAVVDESSVTAPTRYQGQVMLRAEAVAATTGWPTCALRLGGIYGPQRDGLLRRVRGHTAAWAPQTHYTNRIHRDDAVGAILHLLQSDIRAPIYNGVDNLAAQQNDILRFLAARLNAHLPEPPALSASAQVTGKRVSNALLRSHGYICRYPTYQEGFDALLLAESSR